MMIILLFFLYVCNVRVIVYKNKLAGHNYIRIARILYHFCRSAVKKKCDHVESNKTIRRR